MESYALMPIPLGLSCCDPYGLQAVVTNPLLRKAGRVVPFGYYNTTSHYQGQCPLPYVGFNRISSSITCMEIQ
jgi:hypothetical protein